MIVEPIRDGFYIGAQLVGKVFHGRTTGVGVEGEGHVERLPLVVREESSALLGDGAGLWGRVAVVVQQCVQGGRSVRAGIQGPWVSPLERLPLVVLYS